MFLNEHEYISCKLRKAKWNAKKTQREYTLFCDLCMKRLPLIPFNGHS